MLLMGFISAATMLLATMLPEIEHATLRFRDFWNKKLQPNLLLSIHTRYPQFILGLTELVAVLTLVTWLLLTE
jgi:hypothetical protein